MVIRDAAKPHPLVCALYEHMTLPLICAPMFIISNPDLVVAQCINGVMGSFPALNARPQTLLADWLAEISTKLDTYRQAHSQAIIAPYAVNQIIHHSNDRLDVDLAECARHRVPYLITSLRAPGDLVADVHAWGGKIFHDVTTIRHAEKALEAGVDGLILVANGAGGHAGTLSPFALLAEVRRFFAGPIALSGAIATGAGVLGALAMGADFAYMGTRFIASAEAHASPSYKDALVAANAADILYTSVFTGIAGNYLKASIVHAGLDPANLSMADASTTNFGTIQAKPWKDIWGAGQGVGSIDSVQSAAAIVATLHAEYLAAQKRLHGIDTRATKKALAD